VSDLAENSAWYVILILAATLYAINILELSPHDRGVHVDSSPILDADNTLIDEHAQAVNDCAAAYFSILDEIGARHLQGTWLVTLSACDTGSGEVRAGEGVMGLRRGFIQAGAQNLLMTLWPINDEVTVQIMSDFYEAPHKTGNAPEALAEVQRNWLLKLRTEKGLAQAVDLAGPFIMTSQGKP